MKDILWDFDGTLFDTYPATVEAFQKALAVRGIRETGEHILDYLKISESHALTHFKGLYGLDQDFMESYALNKKRITPQSVLPFPFAKEVCRQFTAMGGRNYIITHRGSSTLRFLEHHEMLCYFTEIVTKQHGFKRKPDPEAFLYLIEKYQMDRAATLIVGDRDCEILGGKAAGIKTCLYDTNHVSMEVVPDFYVESLENLLEIIK